MFKHPIGGLRPTHWAHTRIPDQAETEGMGNQEYGTGHVT